MFPGGFQESIAATIRSITPKEQAIFNQRSDTWIAHFTKDNRAIFKFDWAQVQNCIVYLWKGKCPKHWQAGQFQEYAKQHFIESTYPLEKFPPDIDEANGLPQEFKKLMEKSEIGFCMFLENLPMSYLSIAKHLLRDKNIINSKAFQSMVAYGHQNLFSSFQFKCINRFVEIFEPTTRLALYKEYIMCRLRSNQLVQSINEEELSAFLPEYCEYIIAKMLTTGVNYLLLTAETREKYSKPTIPRYLKIETINREEAVIDIAAQIKKNEPDNVDKLAALMQALPAHLRERPQVIKAFSKKQQNNSNHCENKKKNDKKKNKTSNSKKKTKKEEAIEKCSKEKSHKDSLHPVEEINLQNHQSVEALHLIEKLQSDSECNKEKKSGSKEESPKELTNRMKNASSKPSIEETIDLPQSYGKFSMEANETNANNAFNARKL